MSDAVGTANSFVNAAQFIGGQIAKSYGGPIGQAVSSILLGQPGLTASWANMLAKRADGTLTGNDVADVFQDIASVLAGFGVLAGYAQPWVLVAVGIGGAFNFVTKNWSTFDEFWCDAERGAHAGYQTPEIIGPQAAIDAGLLNPKTLLPTVISRDIGNAADPEVTTIRWIPVVDPLVLDLDGDGLEIKSLNSGAEVLFDTNADGVRTATAWVASDDGLLVLDRNGNGLIDDGDLLLDWAGASDYVGAAEAGLARGYGVIMRDPRDAQEAGWLDMAAKADKGTRWESRA